ncbi:hypothetical protein D3C78_1603040 [compost metagenome]
MYQRRIGTLAQGGNEAVGGQLLAGAGAGGFAGQGRLEFFGVQLQILGKAVDKQVAEPHGDEALLKQRRALFLLARSPATGDCAKWLVCLEFFLKKTLAKVKRPA